MALVVLCIWLPMNVRMYSMYSTQIFLAFLVWCKFWGIFFYKDPPHFHRRDPGWKHLRNKAEYKVRKYFGRQNILLAREKMGPWRCAKPVRRINALQWLSWTVCQLWWNYYITFGRKTSPRCSSRSKNIFHMNCHIDINCRNITYDIWLCIIYILANCHEIQKQMTD